MVKSRSRMETPLRNLWPSCRNFFKSIFFVLSHSILLPLRYKIEMKGDECLDIKKGGSNSSILFLSNHSSHIDATILGISILKKHLPLTIWALDLTFKLPYLRWAARHKDSIQVVKVPNINERRSEKHSTKLHKLVTRTGDGLRKGEKFSNLPLRALQKDSYRKNGWKIGRTPYYPTIPSSEYYFGSYHGTLGKPFLLCNKTRISLGDTFYSLS